MKIHLGLECATCKNAAFYLSERPKNGEPIKASIAYTVTNIKPEPYKKVRCQFCEAPVYTSSLKSKNLKLFEVQ